MILQKAKRIVEKRKKFTQCNMLTVTLKKMNTHKNSYSNIVK